MNPQQFLTVLLARKWLVVMTLLATVTTTVVVSLLLPKQYTSTASVVVDFRGGDQILGALMPAQTVPGYLATQVDIIESRNVALKVIKQLKLDESQVAQEQFQEETEGRGTIQNWLAGLLQRKLDVKPSRESSVIEINFTGSDPKFATAVANAYAQAYVDTNLELRVEPARQSAQWFDQRTRNLRDELEVAQGKLSAYQREKGITAADERFDTETSRLDQLSAQLSQAQAATYDVLTRQRQARHFLDKGGVLDQLPDVQNNPLLQSLKSDLARKEAKLQEIASQFGRNHPQYLSATAELENTRKQVLDEMRNIATSLTNALQNAQRREAEVRAAVAVQRTKVLELKKERDELAVLIRENESAQRVFDATKTRLSQTSLESQASQTNIAVLNAAVEPLVPSSPRLFLNTALALAMGLLLGLGAAFLAEMADHRIRTVEDVTAGLQLPVLAELARASHPRVPHRLTVSSSNIAIAK